MGPDDAKDRNTLLQGMMAKTDKEFSLFSKMIYSNFGIDLNESKRSLLVRRLQFIVRKQGFPTFQAYYDYLMSNPTDGNFTELVNRITTNYTFFNREPDHFDYFSKVVLPWVHQSHIATNNRDLRVWCAAASTGEEPYMLAMLMMEFLGAHYTNWNAGILGTDISERALTTATKGRYPVDEFDKLPVHLRNRWFKKAGTGELEANAQLKKEVTYRRFNLINKVYPFKKPFDVIFCRNVMIYFDNPTKEHVVSRLYDCLVPGGYLFLGHSESITRGNNRFNYILPAVYRK